MATDRQRTRPRRPTPVAVDTTNVDAASLLYDMAAVQSAERSRFGYTRAAKAVIAMPASLHEVVSRGLLGKVPFVGPSSAKILTEFAREGRSPTVEAAVDRAGKRAAVDALRALRGGFLSEHVMKAILAEKLPAAIVSREAFNGDLQMHTTWSDGAEPLDVMAQACRDSGHAFMGVTDHSHGLAIAKGMSMDHAGRQGEAIDRLNAGYAGAFRLFKGIEANVLADGSLDLDADERRQFEYVVAAPHALLRRSEDQTARMLRAVTTPGVAILGHPRGRVYNRRAGVAADWPRVFAAAAERDVAIEIDGNWHRQDIDWELAGKALEAGCLFALDSDAHSVEELRFTDYAIAHARLARVPKERVINCWPAERLAEWMTRRGNSATAAGGRSATR